MGALNNPELNIHPEDADKLKSDWVKRVSEADWLNPDQRDVLLALDDKIIQEIKGKDAFRFITTYPGMPDGFKPDNMRETLVGDYKYILAILNLLAGPVNSTRESVKKTTRVPHPNPGWEFSE